MNKGWISINRKLQSHWLWKEKREFSKLEAWLDILLTVNHTQKKTIIKNTLFIIERGESIKSLDTWASRWNWNKSKVRRFLYLLENDNMIRIKNETKTTRITVCKYDSYQDTRNANETQTKRKRNANETQMTPNNNVNNINNENNENKAFDFLVENTTSEFEAFLMQNKKLVNEWDTMVNSFNDKIDLEIAQNKIEFKVEQLIPRLSSYCRSWISNQKVNKKASSPTSNMTF